MECTMFNPHDQIYDEDCFYQYYYMEDGGSLYTTLNQMLITCMLFNVGLLISCWFSGKFLINEVEEIKEKKIRYEDKYPIDLMNKTLKKETDVAKNTMLLENTPDGNVLMRYNLDREGFEYWCDYKSIKYDYLETVARKFVITNFCVDLYKDRLKNIKDQKTKLEEEKKEKERKISEEIDDNITNTIEEIPEESQEEIPEESQEESDDDVFIKPKQLNEKLGIEKEQKKPGEIVATEANKYLYMGKLNEFKWLSKKKETGNEKNISYSQWFGYN